MIQQNFFNLGNNSVANNNSLLNSPPPEQAGAFEIPPYLVDKYNVFNTIIMTHMLDVSLRISPKSKNLNWKILTPI
jgi:hypothetical protein